MQVETAINFSEVQFKNAYNDSNGLIIVLDGFDEARFGCYRCVMLFDAKGFISCPKCGSGSAILWNPHSREFLRAMYHRFFHVFKG